MKKIIIGIIFSISLIKSMNCYASDIPLKTMLEMKGIPQKNVNGLILNEEVYAQSGLYVYGMPQEMKNSQRWKNKEDGNWRIQDKDGNNVSGEYWILGENYMGGAVYNPKFPMTIQTNLEKQWKFMKLPNSVDSWQAKIENGSQNQRNYMLTQKLYQNNVEQESTAQEIGMEKVKIEKAATWQNSGMVTTKKINQDQIEWLETFEIKPMAAQATLSSFISAKGGTKFQFAEKEETLEIIITYGASVQNVSNHASPKDVKMIQSSLYINGQKVDTIARGETYSIQKEYRLVLQKPKEDEPPIGRIHLRCSSFMTTYFISDSIYQNTTDAELTLWIGDELPAEEEKKEEGKIVNVTSATEKREKGAMPKITQIEVKRVTINAKGNEELVDLLVSQKQGLPFICAGQEIEIRVHTIHNTESVTLEIAGDKSIQQLDELTKKFEIEEPKERKMVSKYQSSVQLEKMYRLPRQLTLEIDEENGTKIFSTRYVIPYGTKQTLHSWNSLREKNRNAFQINEEDLFTRITQPYTFYFKARSEKGTTTNIKKIDVFETWNTLYNRDLTKHIR